MQKNPIAKKPDLYCIVTEKTGKCYIKSFYQAVSVRVVDLLNTLASTMTHSLISRADFAYVSLIVNWCAASSSTSLP